MTHYLKTCEICSSEFTATSHRAKCCSVKCKQRRDNLAATMKRQAQFVEQHKDDQHMPTCKYCGWKAFTLVSHIRYDHSMTAEQYRAEFNVGDEAIYHPSLIEQKSERISGENNPGYQHNGTMSSYSKNFKRYGGLSEEEKEAQITAQAAKLVATRRENNNDATTLEYYTSRGMSHEEAVAARSERQRTFSYDICVEKYGPEDGPAIWLERQHKWRATLAALPPEEQDRIHRERIFALKNKYSQVSYELFESLGRPDASYGSNELHIRWNNSYIFPDFHVGNKIIEFYGDFWHCSPQKYGKDDTVTFPAIGGKQVKKVADVWSKDDMRIKYLQSLGYDVLIVWEGEYRNNKQGTIDKCLDFLNDYESE